MQHPVHPVLCGVQTSRQENDTFFAVVSDRAIYCRLSDFSLGLLPDYPGLPSLGVVELIPGRSGSGGAVSYSTAAIIAHL